MVDEEEEDGVKVKSKPGSRFPIVCNICSRRFVNKDDMSLHVRSAHFGMKVEKENNIESLDVVPLIQIDDNGQDEELSSEDDGMIVDSDTLCQVCCCIFRDKDDLAAHTRLAHPTNSSFQSSGSDHNNSTFDSDQPVNKSTDLLKFSDKDSPVKEQTAKYPTPIGNDTDINPSDSENDEVIDLCDTDASNAKRSEKGVNEKDPQIEKSDCVMLNNDVSKGICVSSVARNYERVVCNICVQEFETKELLTVHIKSDHFGISSYKCAMCAKSFESKDQVIKHYNNCDGETQVEMNVADQLIDAKALESRANLKHKNKRQARKNLTTNSVKQKNITKKSSRVSARTAEKERLLSQPIKDDYDTKKISSAMKDQISRHRNRTFQRNIRKKGRAAFQKSIRKKVTLENEIEKRVKRRKTKKSVIENEDMSKYYTDTRTGFYETLRPCFICGQKFFSSNNELDHMNQKHNEYEKPTISELSSLTHEKFKCLRCGKVGVLNVIQCHLQGKCLRAPFNGVARLDNFYCTVCGEHFDNAKLHDIHVASVHYCHLYQKDIGHFASIPYPHILLYHISPKVCQHCGKNCQFTIKSRTAAERAILQEVSCIEGPYVCPYAHTTRQSRCTLDLLLHHLKFCACRAGVLALQCNNCFKMLLCNNTPDQVDQLRDVIKLDNLECCPKADKSFKCYCCTYDYSWSVVTIQLKASIKRLDRIRDSEYCDDVKKVKRILSLNPSVHTKGPELIAKKVNGINTLVPNKNTDFKNTLAPLDLTKRRKTSFDAIESNLAQIQRKSKMYLPTVNEKKSVSKTGQPPSASDTPPTRDPVLNTVQPIKITNTFKPYQQLQIAPIIDGKQTKHVLMTYDLVPLYTTFIPNTIVNAKHVTSSPSIAGAVKPTERLKTPLPSQIKPESQPHIIEEVSETAHIVAESFENGVHSFNNEKYEEDNQNEFFIPGHGWRPLPSEEKLLVPNIAQGNIALPKRKTWTPKLTLCKICVQHTSTFDKSLFKDEASLHRHMIEHEREHQKNKVKDQNELHGEHQKEKTLPNVVNENARSSDKTIKQAAVKSAVLKTASPDVDLSLDKRSMTRKDVAHGNSTVSKQKNLPVFSKLAVKCRNCLICKKSIDEASLPHHMMTHQSGSTKYTPEYQNQLFDEHKQGNIPTYSVKEPQQVFMCYDCNTSQGLPNRFTDQNSWRQHIRSVHPYCVILECDYEDCTMAFQRPQDLQNHIFSEHSHTFGCAVCLAMFRSEKELNCHSGVVHGKV